MKAHPNNWLIAILLLPALASAHSRLEQSTPAADSVIASMPEEVVLRFSAPLRVTSLIIRSEGEGEERVLDVSAAPYADTLQAKAPKLAPGTYRLEWRGVGRDGHIMSGHVRFTIEVP